MHWYHMSPYKLMEFPAAVFQKACQFNSLIIGKFGIHFKSVISSQILQIKFSSFCDVAIRQMPQNSFHDKSTLVQVMAWCCRATSHYLNQCWHRSGLPYSITRPQWVNSFHAVVCNQPLTHWGRVTHICVSKLTIIGSDNGLSPDRRQAIIWTNAGILLIGP